MPGTPSKELPGGLDERFSYNCVRDGLRARHREALSMTGETPASEHFRQGLTYASKDLFSEAVVAFESAITVDPTYVEAWNNKGAALMELGDYDEAIRHFENAIAIAPLCAEAWYNKAVALIFIGEDGDALEAFEQASALGHGLHDLEIIDAIRSASARSLDTNNPAGALRWCDLLIVCNQGDPDTWNERGCSLFQLGRYEEALASFDGVIKLVPDGIDAWKNRGAALRKLNRHSEAERSFQTAEEFLHLRR